MCSFMRTRTGAIRRSNIADLILTSVAVLVTAAAPLFPFVCDLANGENVVWNRPKFMMVTHDAPERSRLPTFVIVTLAHSQESVQIILGLTRRPGDKYDARRS